MSATGIARWTKLRNASERILRCGRLPPPFLWLFIQTSTLHEFVRVEFHVLERLDDSNFQNRAAVAMTTACAVEKAPVRRNHCVRTSHLVGCFGNRGDVRRQKPTVALNEVLEF